MESTALWNFVAKKAGSELDFTAYGLGLQWTNRVQYQKRLLQGHPYATWLIVFNNILYVVYLRVKILIRKNILVSRSTIKHVSLILCKEWFTEPYVQYNIVRRQYIPEYYHNVWSIDIHWRIVTIVPLFCTNDYQLVQSASQHVKR